MTPVVYHDEYRASERVVLTRGTKFKAKGGPYFIKRDATGKKVRMSMAAKGPFVFYRYAEQGRRQWIEAFNKTGGFTVLCLTPRRSRLGASFVARPYRIAGRAGTRGTRGRGRAAAPQQGPTAGVFKGSQDIATKTTIVYTEGVAEGQRQAPRQRRRSNGKGNDHQDAGGGDGRGLPRSGDSVHQAARAADQRQGDGGVEGVGDGDGIAHPAAGRLSQRRLFD